jgi:HEPN domain-containing protein
MRNFCFPATKKIANPYAHKPCPQVLIRERTSAIIVVMNAETLQTIINELSSAIEARTAGNHGRARVCARRAAGWAIQAYLAEQGGHPEITNALDNIRYYAELPDLDDKVIQVLDHLTLKVVKDSEEGKAYYPLADVDLIAEARWLAVHLLGAHLFPGEG